MTDFELSHAVLMFYPHRWKAPADTATFDVTVLDPAVMSDQRVCTNIDRVTARALRDALNAWLAGAS